MVWGLDNGELYRMVWGEHVCLISVRLPFGGFLGSPSPSSPPALSIYAINPIYLSIYLTFSLSVCLSLGLLGLQYTHVAPGMGLDFLGGNVEGSRIGIGVP